ncbi:MAG: helix-turn-helix transcriptional regulator [Candidatus Aenigmatarchaeota archaeon]
MKNTVRKNRENRGITQGELAEELDVTRQTVNAIEQEKYSPSLELAIKMSEFFEKPVKKLFCLEEGEV